MENEKLVPKLRFNFSSEWKDKKLKDIIQISKEKYNPELDNINYKCIELEHLSQETGILLGFTDSINQNSIKNRFHDGNILFGKLRPYLKKYYFPTFEGVCSSEIWVFNTKEYPKYIYYLIQTKRFLDISNVSSGSKMPRSDWNFMKNYIFSIPDLKTQKEVANLFFTIDKKIELLNEKHDSYVKFKKYLMQQIFAQKLRFDKDCKEIKLKTIVDYQNSKALEKYFNDTNGYEVISIGNYTNDGRYIKNNVFISKDVSEVHKYILNKNDLAMVLNDKTKEGNIIGRCILIDENNKYVYNQRTARLILKEEINPYYLHQLINSPLIHKKIIALSQGATQIYINKNDLLNIKLPIPNIEVQNEIGNLFVNVNKKIDLSSLKVEQMNLFKKGLLQQMFV